MQPNNKGMIRKSGSRFSGQIMQLNNKGMTGKACHRALIRWGKYRVLENIAFHQRVGFPLRNHDIFFTEDAFPRGGALRICALRRNRARRINFDIFL